MGELSMILIIMFTFAVVAVILARVVKSVTSSSWYKRKFAEDQDRWGQLTRLVYQPVKRKLFADLGEHLIAMNGDVLEIGIGSGQNFHDYPEGTSLIAVDRNVHTEKLLNENLVKAGNRVHLKKFIVASAEDMSCTGKVGVQDNSVAAVVCTKLLCSLSEEQIKKTLQEVKRVLMPGGRFFFLEHVVGKPWTLQYVLQQVVSKLQLWPTLFNGCRCDRETLTWIKEGGFKMVQAEKTWVNWTPIMFSGSTSISLGWFIRVTLWFVCSSLAGFAEKEQCTVKKTQ